MELLKNQKSQPLSEIVPANLLQPPEPLFQTKDRLMLKIAQPASSISQGSVSVLSQVTKLAGANNLESNRGLVAKQAIDQPRF
jgi:hypothetical protein